jgi:hypothetical protein
MKTKRLLDVREGETVIDVRPVLKRLPRTGRYVSVGTETWRFVVTSPASAETQFKVIAQRDGVARSFDTQFVNVE